MNPFVGEEFYQTPPPEGKVAAQQNVVYTGVDMQILSFQSAVAYGHVGNSAATLPLQRLGFDVWPVDTVQFSNHPGHGGRTGMILPAAHVEDVIDGLDRVGALDSCDGVLSGYLGESATAKAVARAVGLSRREGRSPPYLCDPVMGDDGGGLYVEAGLPALFRDLLVPMADIITPNRFELALLAEQPVNSLGEAGAASRRLMARGPRMVVTTSLEAGPATIACLAVGAEGAWVVETPMLEFPVAPNGAGDLLAAVLLGRVLSGQALPDALTLAVSGVFGVLERTRMQGRRELALTAAQDEIIRPGRLFAAQAFGG